MSAVQLAPSRMTTVGAYLRLLRPSAVVGAAATVFVGALIAGPLGRNVALAMTATGCAVAAANAFNDLSDIGADSVNRPHRPLPAQQISVRGAWRTVIAASALAMICATSLGAVSGAWVAASLALGLGYSTHLKRILIVGNATVAGLVGNALVFGAYTGGGVGTAAAIGAVEVGLFLFGREALKGTPDIEGDQFDGVVTVATRWGWRAAVNVYLASAAAVMVAALLAYRASGVPVAHVAAIALLVVLPSVWLSALLMRRPKRSVMMRVLDLTKLIWISGLVSVSLIAL